MAESNTLDPNFQQNLVPSAREFREEVITMAKLNEMASQVGGHSDVGSGTDFGRTDLWTDSGCASLGKDTVPTSVGNSSLKQQRDGFDSSQLFDYDENDAATVYTDADSVPETFLETYKLELSRAIFEAVRPHVSDTEQLESLSSPLPALLESFALRLGCPSSSTEERKIMYFVHKHRNQIADRFDDAIKDTAEEDPTPSAAGNNDDQAGWDVGEWLQEVMPYTHDNGYQEIPGLNPEMEYPRLEQEEEEEEHPSLPDSRGYRDAVFNSVAYSWLTAALVKTLTMAPVEEDDMCADLREKIQASLGRTRTISSRSPSKRHAMAFTAEWDPKLFLREQFPDESDTGRLFRQVLTLTGSATDAQALPCAEYLLQTWPTTGLSILEIVEDALVTGMEVSRELKDKSLVSCLFDHSELHVKVEGTADSIATVAEQIIWLGASLRQSCSESGLATCRPQIRISGSTAAGAPPNCHIEFSVEEHNTSSQESGDGQCWHGIFQNPVVVGGYPIPRRTQYGSGLEIPLNVMAGLTGCPRINQYMGHHFLKGFSTALVPTEKMKDAVLWHLYYSEDDSRLPYPDMEPMDQVNISLGELTQARHIVGWCSKAQFFAGAAGMNYNIELSQLKQPGREFSLEKVSFSVGQIVTGGLQFAIGRKDEPVRITRNGYERKLAWLQRKYVTLWDVGEKRGWLVNGNAALLHLLRASLEYYKTNEFNAGFLFQEELFEESSSPLTLGSVRDVLLNPINQKLQLYLNEERSYTETKIFPSGKSETVTKTITSWTTVKDRVEELYETLEKLIDHNVTSEASYKGKNAKPRFHDLLQGWEFSEIATDQDSFDLKYAKLPLDLMSWVEFTRAIPALTLFGKGFGDIIRASPPATNCCQGWEVVPTEKHLLCISVADLRAIIKLTGGNLGTNPIRAAPGILWKNPFNDSPFHTTCLCATRREAMKGKDHQCIQELVSTTAHAVSSMAHSASSWLGFSPSPESVVDIHLTEHDNGAVIFGRRAEWKFSRDTPTAIESTDPESSQAGALGHSSTSGGSNVAESFGPSLPATLQASDTRGHNSPVTLSAVSGEIQVLGPTSTVDEPESGSQTPDSPQVAGLEQNDPPSEVLGSLIPESSRPKRMSLMRKVTKSIAKKWRGRKSGDP
ncbi:hypothetical protein B0J15DRAFT_94008 [Fusarium solani]|uniref:Pfs domain protein n=1 Tax=Fusarium solani TaxID=169388 RepID=A0A9P9K3Z1_FUSSL|nr:uncharacterized protein B0J15DRAFT_94008 [Fusarium solani]KAH7243150.1 hypothetical protein B0J15DRAFT_94008 [Fusarium solani]